MEKREVARAVSEEVIPLEQVIVEILKQVGVYQQAREKVGSDAELVRLFDQNFDELIQLVSK